MVERFAENLPHIAAILILVACSGAISASETALFALTPRQLADRAAAAQIGWRIVLALRREPRALLSTVLLTNTAINILLYSVLGVTVFRISQGSPLWTTALGIGGFVFAVFFAEILPKQAALALAARVAPRVALPLRVLQTITGPVRWLLENFFVEPLTRLLAGTAERGPSLSPEEIQDVVSVWKSEGRIDDREYSIIHHVVGLARTRVSALMVPRVDFVAFDLADPPEKLARLFVNSRLLRLPVFEGNIDHVVGIIHAREFFHNREKRLRDLIRPVHFVPEQANVESLLNHFRRTGTQIAVAVDEYGGLAGVIALEDVLEAIVGDIAVPDEPLAGPPLVRISETEYLADARMNVEVFRRAFDLPPEETRVDRLGGFVAERLGKLPAPGDEVRFELLRLRVESVRRRRVLSVRVLLDAPMAPNPDLHILLGPASTAVEPPSEAARHD